MEKTDFLMAPAYTGGVVNFLFWGATVIDLAGDGLRNSGPLPALRQHQHDRNVGIITRVSRQDHALHAEGRFLEASADGREVAALAREGYPWQASVSFTPEVVEQFDKGEKVTVNGRRLEGPLVVIRKARLREISFVGLGLDPDTAVMPMSAVQAAARQEWDASPALRREFGQIETYLAYQRAKNAGLVGVLRHREPPGIPVNLEAQARQEWDGSPALRREFGQVETYLAWRQAQGGGLVKI